MSLNINTYILKGLDSNQTNLLSSTLEYISSAKNINNKITIVDNLSLQLQKTDFLIIIIDELLLEQITQNVISKEFFTQNKYQQNQIILILDDINIKSLPDYLRDFQAFLTSTNNNNIDDAEEWDDEESQKINLTEIIDDVVHYINKVSLGINKDKLTIYLGPTDDNTLIEYQKITRELLHRNYNILPEISNSNNKDALNNEEYLLRMIASSDLCIHFIGHKSILDYPNNNSLAMKINNIAVEYCKKPEGDKLQRIIYVPSEKKVLDEILDQKIQQFKGDTNILFNAELIQTSIEKFKEVVLHKLEDISNPIHEKTIIANSNNCVYFIYPPGKETDITSYINWFEKNNIDYKKSQVELDQLALISYHKNQLITCSSVIVHNSGNNQWLNRKLSDIKKSPGWGRKKPFKVKLICGLQSDDELLQKDEDTSFIVINDCNELNQNQIKELLTD